MEMKRKRHKLDVFFLITGICLAAYSIFLLVLIICTKWQNPTLEKTGVS